MNDDGFTSGLIIGLFIGIMALFLVCSYEHDAWQEKLIELELAEFEVDPKTGNTKFVIYAEGEK